MTDSRVIHQPIHPDIRGLLDPEYVAFHEENLQYIPPSESSPWDRSQPTSPSPFAAVALESVDVDSIQDVVLKHSELRIFTPRVPPPSQGWPVFLWFHGGEYPNSRIKNPLVRFL
jgi:acetyl esterase/lipase